MNTRFLTPLCVSLSVFLLCGFSVQNQNEFVDDLEKNVDILKGSDKFQELNYQHNYQLELQQQFEKDVARMIRAQEDIERSAALGLANKKTLTKEEKKEFLAVYKGMPKTVEEYQEMSKDIKRSERKLEAPYKFRSEKDDKFEKLPEPRYLLKKYNKPAGIQNINLKNLIDKRDVNSIGVMSPDKDKMAYTRVYYSGYNDKVSSEVYYIELDKTKSPKNRLKTASFMNKNQILLMDSAVKEEYPSLFKTLTIIDWSEDSTKLALKERVGSSVFGMWQTNVWIYDLSNNTAKKLTSVRESVRYHIRKNQNIDIDDYRWDIVPLGWDAAAKNRIIVCAYAYTTKRSTRFLGLYSVDDNNENTQLISDTPMSINTSANGLMLKAVYD